MVLLDEGSGLATTVLICKIWALILTCVGGFGNLLTIISIIHEIIYSKKQLNKRKYFIREIMSKKPKKNLVRASSLTLKYEHHKPAMRKFSVATCNIISSIIEGTQTEDSVRNSMNTFQYLNLTPCARRHFAPGSPGSRSNGKLNEIPLRVLNLPSTQNILLAPPKNGTTRNKTITKSNTVDKTQSLNSIEALNKEFELIPKSLPKIPKTVLKCDRGTIIILSLSITDFLYCFINLPLSCYVYNYYTWSETPSPTLCLVSGFVRYVITYAEWMTLAFLTVERCINLRRCKKARLLTPCQTILCLMGIWVFSIILQVRPLSENRFAYDNRTKKCDYVCQQGGDSSRDKIYFFTLITFIPCFLMLFGCVSISIQILQNRKNLIQNGMSQKIMEQKRREIRSSLTVVFGLLLLFFVCVIPICVCDTLSGINTLLGKKPPEVEVSIAVQMLYWLQFGVNYVIYVAANPSFRVAYKNLFKAAVGWRCSGWWKREEKRRNIIDIALPLKPKSSCLENVKGCRHPLREMDKTLERENK